MGYYALFYEVVDDFVERRAPFRDEHLRLAREAHRNGEIVLAGALAELPEAVIGQLTRKICDASLGGRLGQVSVECAPRRRTRGLLQAVFSRLLIPTADWSKPCGSNPGTQARAASGRSA